MYAITNQVLYTFTHNGQKCSLIQIENSFLISDSAANKFKSDCGALILFWMNVSYLLDSIYQCTPNVTCSLYSVWDL